MESTPIQVDRERLTGVVLGLLRCLPPKLWFGGFVETLRATNQALGDWLVSTSPPLVRLWPRIPVAEAWGNKLGSLPNRRGGPVPPRTICPEAVIETDDWVAIVNAVADEVGDGRQLFQDFSVIRATAGDKKHLLVHINSAEFRRLNSGISLGGVDPAKRVLPHDTLERLLSISSDRLPLPAVSEDDVANHLGWLNWQKLHTVLSAINLESDSEFNATPQSYQVMIRRTLDDAVALLESAGLCQVDYDMLSLLNGMTVDARLIGQLGDVAEWEPPPIATTPEPKPDTAEPAVDAAAIQASEDTTIEPVAAEKAAAEENEEPASVEAKPAPAKAKPAPVDETPVEKVTERDEPGPENVVTDLNDFSIDFTAIPTLNLAEKTK